MSLSQDTGKAEGLGQPMKSAKESMSGDYVDAALAEDDDMFTDKRPWYKSKLWTVCVFILVVELCERLCYYTFEGSQRNFLMLLGYPASQATSLNAAFSVLCYLSPILGGWLADSRLGRYKSVSIFAAIYVVGVYLAAAASYPGFKSEGLYLFAVFGLVALGTGGIKANNMSFGADQYDTTKPSEVKEQEAFFSYFYGMINIGATIAFGYMVTLATSGSGAIPKAYGFFSAYMIGASCMLVAFCIFLSGTPRYIKKPHGGDSLMGLVYYIGGAARTSRKGAMAASGWVVMIIFICLSVIQAFITDHHISTALSYTALGLAAYSCTVLCVCHARNHFIEAVPEHPDGSLTIREAKGMLDVVPTILVVNCGFMVIYNCMNGPMQSQACQMNIQIGSGQINGALFNIGDCFAIIIMIPVFESAIFPLITRMKGSAITRTQKLVSGMVVAAMGVMVAAALEYARRAAPVLDVLSDCAPPGVYMSDISGFLMFIPFFLIGTGEVLINPCIYYFVYDQAPPRTRSLTQAFNLLAAGAISNGFTASITTALQRFYTDNLNDGHIYYFYYISASAAVIAIPLYLFFASIFEEKNYEDMNADDMSMSDDAGKAKESQIEMVTMDADSRTDLH